jgi:predicted metal-dependent phosphoesterase TrpH
MTRTLVALVLILLALVGIQSTRLKTAQEAREAIIVEWRTRGAEVRAVHPLRARKALAGASATAAAAIAASAPESWSNSPVPEEIHAALRDFDGPAPDGVRGDAQAGTHAPD